MKLKVAYGLLFLLALWVYFIPWSHTGLRTFTGFNWGLPFTFTYIIGLVLALIVLFSDYKPVGLTILAGILMFVGVIGGMIGIDLDKAVANTATTAMAIDSGLGLAFFMSIIYTVGGAIIGNKMKNPT